MTEIPTSSEITNISNLDQVPDALGYYETEEMERSRGLLVANYSAELLTVYQVLAEEYVDKVKEDSDKKRIGYMVSLALIRRDVGRIAEHLQDLEDAIDYAYGMGFHNIAEFLEQRNILIIHIL